MQEEDIDDGFTPPPGAEDLQKLEEILEKSTSGEKLLTDYYKGSTRLRKAQEAAGQKPKTTTSIRVSYECLERLDRIAALNGGVSRSEAVEKLALDHEQVWRALKVMALFWDQRVGRMSDRFDRLEITISRLIDMIEEAAETAPRKSKRAGG